MSDFARLQEQMVEVLIGDDPDAVVPWAAGVMEGGVEALDFFKEVFTPAIAQIGDSSRRSKSSCRS
jgi:hypothetical protein